MLPGQFQLIVRLMHRLAWQFQSIGSLMDRLLLQLKPTRSSCTHWCKIPIAASGINWRAKYYCLFNANACLSRQLNSKSVRKRTCQDSYFKILVFNILAHAIDLAGCQSNGIASTIGLEWSRINGFAGTICLEGCQLYGVARAKKLERCQLNEIASTFDL